MTFELGGFEDERHGGSVHVHVGEMDIGKLAADAGNDFAPQPRALQNVRLVDREQAPAAGARELKCDAGNALDLRLAVAHGVDGLARAGDAVVLSINGTGLAEIQSAEQFAHDENVGSFDDFFAQRRAGSQRGIIDSGTEVGESAELLAEAQQSSFGAKFARIMIEGRTADGSKQHGLGGEAGLNCSVRQGIAELCQSNAADFFFVKLEIVAKAAGHFF